MDESGEESLYHYFKLNYSASESSYSIALLFSLEVFFTCVLRTLGQADYPSDSNFSTARL